MQGGAPCRVVPQQYGVGGDEQVGLRSQRPIGEPLPGHQGAHDTREEHRGDASLGYLFYFQVFREEGGLRRTETGEDESEEGVAAEGHEVGLVIVVGDEGRAEKEDDVYHRTCHHVEPEHGIIVFVCGTFQVDQGRLETATLQLIGDERKDADHGDHTIIVGREQSSEDDAKDQSYELLHAIVHAAPKQSFCRLLF